MTVYFCLYMYLLNFPCLLCYCSKKEKEKKKKSEPILDISDPMVLDQYIVIADYQKQKNSECSISAGQIVEVIDKNENGRHMYSRVEQASHSFCLHVCMSDSTGWWFVHMDDFNEGWIPATYLEPVYGVPSDGHQVQRCYSVSTLRTLFTKSSSVEFPTCMHCVKSVVM